MAIETWNFDLAHSSIKFSVRQLMVSTSVSVLEDGRLQVTGVLTIRGAAGPVLLDVEYAGRVKDPWGGERAGFTARTSIDRKVFGLLWNKALETGGILVGDKVEIEIDIEAVRQLAQGEQGIPAQSA